MPFKDQTIGSALKDVYNKNIQNESGAWNEYYTSNWYGKDLLLKLQLTLTLHLKKKHSDQHEHQQQGQKRVLICICQHRCKQYSANYTGHKYGALSTQAMNAFNRLWMKILMALVKL